MIIMLEINITLDKNDIDIQSIIILIDKLKDIQIANGKFIIINELFISKNNLNNNGMTNIKIIVINTNIIYELLTPQVIVLFKLDW